MLLEPQAKLFTIGPTTEIATQLFLAGFEVILSDLIATKAEPTMITFSKWQKFT